MGIEAETVFGGGERLAPLVTQCLMHGCGLGHRGAQGRKHVLGGAVDSGDRVGRIGGIRFAWMLLVRRTGFLLIARRNLWDESGREWDLQLARSCA
jgi:hypothetical protein